MDKKFWSTYYLCRKPYDWERRFHMGWASQSLYTQRSDWVAWGHRRMESPFVFTVEKAEQSCATERL